MQGTDSSSVAFTEWHRLLKNVYVLLCMYSSLYIYIIIY